MKKRLLGLLFALTILIGVIAMLIWNNKRIEHEREAMEYKENILNFTPEDVIRQHFKWINNRNVIGLPLTIYGEEVKLSRRNFRNIINIELISMSEVTDERTLNWLRGSPRFPEKEKFYDIEIFIVRFDVSRRQEIGFSDGINEDFNIMVRENADSPWLIYTLIRAI